MMKNRLDVIGIGNAMVDLIIHSTKQEIEKNGFIRDSHKYTLLDIDSISISRTGINILYNDDIYLFDISTLDKSIDLINFSIIVVMYFSII